MCRMVSNRFNRYINEANEHTEYGLWKVCIGDENKYVVKDGFDTYRWLYLTEETFNNISSE